MSGGQTTQIKRKRRTKRKPVRHPPVDDRLLYRRIETKGGAVRYLPWGRIWERDAMPLGSSLVTCGERSLSYQALDPQVTEAQAALLAASEIAEPAMIRAMMECSRERPEKRPLTDRERAGWEAYCRAIGERGIMRLELASAQEIVDAGLRALREAVERCRATDELLGDTIQETTNTKERR